MVRVAPGARISPKTETGASGTFEDLCRGSTLAEHGHEVICVAADVGVIRGHVRHREERRKLAQDLRLVRFAVPPRCRARLAAALRFHSAGDESKTGDN
jgi:hypothetical protein